MIRITILILAVVITLGITVIVRSIKFPTISKDDNARDTGSQNDNSRHADNGHHDDNDDDAFSNSNNNNKNDKNNHHCSNDNSNNDNKTSEGASPKNTNSTNPFKLRLGSESFPYSFPKGPGTQTVGF